MRFKAFFFLGGIIYQPANKNGLNRIFGKNNFLGAIGQKNSGNFFFVKISKLCYISKNFEKKSLPV